MARRAGLFAKNDDTDPVANHSHSNEVTDRGPELSGGEPAANPGPPDPHSSIRALYTSGYSEFI